MTGLGNIVIMSNQVDPNDPYQLLPIRYPKGVVRRGGETLTVQHIVKPWIEDVKVVVANILMTTPHRVSASQVVEVLLRAWHQTPEAQKIQLVRGSELVTKRKWGRPKGKSTADWDSSLK